MGFGTGSPGLYRFIFAVLAGALLARGHVVAGVVTLVIALVLAWAWQRYGAAYKRDRQDSIF
jgi:hypothetical protein